MRASLFVRNEENERLIRELQNKTEECSRWKSECDAVRKELEIVENRLEEKMNERMEGKLKGIEESMKAMQESVKYKFDFLKSQMGLGAGISPIGETGKSTPLKAKEEEREDENDGKLPKKTK